MKERFLLTLKRWGFAPLTLAVWGIAAVLVGVAGPFGSFTDHTPITRVTYWFVLLGLSILIANALRALFQALGSPPGTTQFMLGMPVVFGVIFSPIILVTRGLLQPPNANAGGLWYLFILSTLVFTAVLAIRRMMGLDCPPDAAAPRLLRRLEHHQDQPITRLTVEDHYVIVYFVDGTKERLLMRFSDAITEMEPVSGLCVHRSHWVSYGAIRSVETTKGRDTLCLKDGTRLPVGPKYRMGLKKSGLV